MGFLDIYARNLFGSHYHVLLKRMTARLRNWSYEVDVLAAAPGPVITGFGDRLNMRMDLALKTSDVGVPILKALGRKTTVLPGLLTKFLVGSLRMLPRWGKVSMMGVVMGGMTKHQRM